MFVFEFQPQFILNILTNILFTCIPTILFFSIEQICWEFIGGFKKINSVNTEGGNKRYKQKNYDYVLKKRKNKIWKHDKTWEKKSKIETKLNKCSKQIKGGRKRCWLVRRWGDLKNVSSQQKC